MPTKTSKKRYSVRVDDPSVQISPEAYGSTRARLRKQRGRAEDGPCSKRGCKTAAVAWGFTPRRTAEVYVAPGMDGAPTGPRFSLDVEKDYSRFCGEHLGEHRKAAAKKASPA
jgi:hypothetical protein